MTGIFCECHVPVVPHLPAHTIATSESNSGDHTTTPLVQHKLQAHLYLLLNISEFTLLLARTTVLG